jgi:coenzyme F420 hydrogenase subunit beta
MSIDKVVNNEFCIGCGACKLINNEISFSDTKGIPVANLDLVPDSSLALLNKVCPFSEQADNEDVISKRLYPSNIKQDEDLGRFIKTYAFRVKSDKINSSSSGGGATWLLENLLKSNMIDKIIHVKEVKDGNSLFQYCISSTLQELDEGRKSKYYPVSFEKIISLISEDKKNRYAVTAIPCFSKAIRLLQNQGLLTNIQYVVGIFCGHYKSKYFHQFNALQLGVKPSDILNYDFRVKSKNFKADDYFMSVTTNNEITKFGRISELFANSWGYGLFKPKACEFCDDISGETSDVVFGDAWLNQYTSNSQGTNVVILRNEKLLQFFESSNEIFLEPIKKEDVINSQMGNFRHRRGGVIARNQFVLGWKPKKRTELCEKHYTQDRFDLYKYRWNLSEFSQNSFETAHGNKSYNFFFLLLRLKILVFEYNNKNLFGHIKSEVIRKLRKVLRLLKNRKM